MLLIFIMALVFLGTAYSNDGDQDIDATVDISFIGKGSDDNYSTSDPFKTQVKVLIEHPGPYMIDKLFSDKKQPLKFAGFEKAFGHLLGDDGEDLRSNITEIEINGYFELKGDRHAQLVKRSGNLPVFRYVLSSKTISWAYWGLSGGTRPLPFRSLLWKPLKTVSLRLVFTSDTIKTAQIGTIRAPSLSHCSILQRFTP